VAESVLLLPWDGSSADGPLVEERASGGCLPSPDFLSPAPSAWPAQSRCRDVEGMGEKREKERHQRHQKLKS